MKFVRSALVVATATMVPLLPTTAYADAKSHVDARGDVQSISLDAQGHLTDAPAVPVPMRALGDITSVRATNGARTVKIVVRFNQLIHAGDLQEHAIGLPSSAKDRLVVVDASPANWAGKAHLYTPSGKKVRCTVHHRIVYAENKLVVKVPQSCMGHPKVLKVGARTFIEQGSQLFWDDGFRTAGNIKDPFSWSPRIHR